MSRLKVIHCLSLATIVALILVLFNFVSEIYPDTPEYPKHAHITLYLDRNFSEDESEIIMQAALEWTRATNHIIDYDVVQLPSKEKIYFKDSVFITKRSIDDPQIILMDFTGKNKTLGVYERRGVPYISIVADRLHSEDYKEVVLHELGHSLGIGHLEGDENIDTLMYPYTSINVDGIVIKTGNSHITKKDLIAFCKLYHCDVNNL